MLAVFEGGGNFSPVNTRQKRKKGLILKDNSWYDFFPLHRFVRYGKRKPQVLTRKEIGVVTTTELIRFFAELQDNPGSGVCVRTRLLGEMWHPNFMSVLMITQSGVIILNDEIQRKAVTILRPQDVVQFEIDKKFQNFEPHFHYDVVRD